jgi:hypothetical protein
MTLLVTATLFDITTTALVTTVTTDLLGTAVALLGHF